MKYPQVYLSPDEVKQRGRKFINNQAQVLKKELFGKHIQLFELDITQLSQSSKRRYKSRENMNYLDF